MGIELLPQEILDKYEVHEWKHACAILKSDFPTEFEEIISLLKDFKLCKSWVEEAGGSKSRVAKAMDDYLFSKGWQEKKFMTSVKIDETVKDSPTHKVDCYKNRIALEIEWNNKDPFYDRDLNNFRMLFDLRAISVGIIITRCTELQAIFTRLGKGTSYGPSTTHMSKLLPRLEGGSGGGCPILVFGISDRLYDENC